MHDPERTEERRVACSERGKAGQAKRAARNRAARAELVTAVALDTSSAIRGALERALANVEASGADPVAKANVSARVCSVALDIIRTVGMERELADLRRLIEERTGRTIQ